jgi:hypothetical protein
VLQQVWGLLLERQTRQEGGGEQAEGQAEGQVEGQVEPSALEALARDNCLAPTLQHHLFSQATTRFRLARGAQLGHLLPKITRRAVPRKHTWHGTSGCLALQELREHDPESVEKGWGARQRVSPLQVRQNARVAAALQVFAGILKARATIIR